MLLKATKGKNSHCVYVNLRYWYRYMIFIIRSLIEDELTLRNINLPYNERH
jgi:hypothetical protein